MNVRRRTVLRQRRYRYDHCDRVAEPARQVANGSEQAGWCADFLALRIFTPAATLFHWQVTR